MAVTASREAAREQLSRDTHKAGRNRPLDLVQGRANPLLNHYRTLVEAALAHLRRFKLLAGTYCGPERSCDDTVLAVSGLYAFCAFDAHD